MVMVKLTVTTNPGIEDLVIEELECLLKGYCKAIKPHPKFRGRVIVELDINEKERNSLAKVFEILTQKATMINKIFLLLNEAKISKDRKGLEDIYELVYSTNDIAKYITPQTTFAIRAERVGVHDFTSIDIGRVAGDAVRKLVANIHKGEPAPVNLDYPNVEIGVDVYDDLCSISLILTGDTSLHKRGYRVYDHPGALKPTLANAMLRLSKVKDGETLLDPMCGGGTIPIEAALHYNLSCIKCYDISPKHIRGAILNAISANVEDKIEFRVQDARKLHEVLDEESIDVIVSNPPYGIRIGRKSIIDELYKDFILSAYKVLKKNGRITIITTEHKTVKRVIKEYNLRLRIVHERTVSHGDLWPNIIVLSKV